MTYSSPSRRAVVRVAVAFVPASVLFHYYRRNTSSTLRRIGLREDNVKVGDAAIRNEFLVTRDDVLVSLAPRCGADCRRVRAGIGLRQCQGGYHLPRGNPGQK